ncbi:hypothetical protein ACFX1R_034105 [Malus domestica]
MGKKDFLIDLPFVAKVERNRHSYSFCKVYGFSTWTCKIKTNSNPTGCAKTMFVARISVGDVSQPTSTQLPERLATVDAFCQASALLRACRARLKKNDRVNIERCLCGALGIGPKAHNKD